MTKPREVDDAYIKFFGDLPPQELETTWEELFLEWLVFDYKQSGKASFLIEYVLKNPDGLMDKEIDSFRQIAQTHIYSMFEIREIERGEWFVLEDLHTGKAYQVYEKKGTLSIKEAGTIPGRIANVDDRWYLVGANSIYLPIVYTQKLKQIMRKTKIKNYSPKDTVDLLRHQALKSAEGSFNKEHGSQN